MIRTRTTGWIGVDIGTHTVKLAQVQRRGGRLELSEALVVRRREAWQDSGAAVPPVVSSSDEVRAALSLGQRFRGRDAAVAMTMSMCDVRGLNVPDTADGERRELVAKELEVVAGPANDNREFDFWPVDLGTEKAPSPENVLVASISRDWTEQVTQDLTSAKLVGQVLDVLPFALARAIELTASSSSEVPVAAVDWGFRRATFCVVLHGKPIFVRCLRDAGFSNVISAVCRALSVSSEEAQKLLTDHGLPTATSTEELQEVIAEVATQPLEILCEELERTMTFLRQQRRALVPQEVILFGGGATTRNIGGYLADKLGVAVVPWSFGGPRSAAADHFPAQPLLGSAIALSTLAWEAR